MLKKLRKTLNKEFKKRYDKMESHYLGLENRIYTTIEDRLSNLEEKFEDLSTLIRDEIRFRKERNEDKLEDIEAEGTDIVFSETVGEIKEAIADEINDTKEDVKEKVEEVKEKVQQAKEAVTKKLKKAKKDAQEVKEDVQEYVEHVKDTVEEIVSGQEDDLTAIKGLGSKMAEKLAAEGITSFNQLAGMTAEEVEALDAKIKSFAARFKRYDWGQQAKDLK